MKWFFIPLYIKCHFNQFWLYLKIRILWTQNICDENFAARKSPRKLNFKDPFFYQTSFGFWISTELWMNVCKKGKRNINNLELCFILNLTNCDTWKWNILGSFGRYWNAYHYRIWYHHCAIQTSLYDKS